MSITREEMSDHLVSCQFCRNIREHANEFMVEHTKLDKNSKDCVSCHVNNCSSCRRKSLGLYTIVSWHIKLIQLKKKIRKIFGFRN